MTNADEPAFPFASTEYGDENGFYPGLSKRELFAALAMMGAIASPNEFDSYEKMAKCCLKSADALLQEISDATESTPTSGAV